MKPSAFSALPTPEAVAVIKKAELPSFFVNDWYSVPTLNPPLHRLGLGHFQNPQSQVDAMSLLSPFFGHPILSGSLRTFDLLNGCNKGCDTCLAASSFPSKIFSYDSLERLFHHKPFLALLQPDSLRSGSSGDSLDHPEAIRIFEMILRRTFWMDMKHWFQTRGQSRHKIKVFTNFRVYPEEKDWGEQNKRLNRLLRLAQRHPQRLRVAISLPLNRVDTVNHQFENFALTRPDIFTIENGKVHALTKLPFVTVLDVRNPFCLFTSGRCLSREHLKEKIDSNCLVEADRPLNYIQRGLAKVYLNPDALWLQVYATMKESPTTRTFTPLTPENLETLSQLPYHPDFPTPPNWPGATKKERTPHRAYYLKTVNAHKRSRRRVIVK